jgi:hypothetical protein
MKINRDFVFLLILIISGAGIIFFILYLPYTVLINYGTQALAWHKFLAVRKFREKK